LFIVRDRFGEKPLYYYKNDECIYWASELKSIKIAAPNIKNAISRKALSLYFALSYIPAPYSIYQDVSKLRAGHYLSIDTNNNCISEHIYWDIPKPKTLINDYEEAKQKLKELLVDSVEKRMIADVPIGVFLSGGVDSTIIAAIMANLSPNKKIKTFSIGFDSGAYDETPKARQAAEYIGSEHYEFRLNGETVLEQIDKVILNFDEPFADSSQIPTYLVSKLAASSVKVSLSGDGGDELFGGYNRYLFANNFWDKLNHFPASLRKVLSRLLNSVSPENWNLILNNVHFLLPKNLKVNNIGDKIHKASNILSSSSIDEVYFKLLIQWSDPGLLLNKHFLNTQNILPGKESKLNNIEKMMLKDLLSYLPDDILCKVDRASMSVSLESRIPFLDHHLFEFSSKLPISLKIKQGSSKWILKEILKKYLPVHLVERPKMGFALPIDQWLRGPLKDWANFLLDKNEMLKDGILNPLPIHQKWEEHLSGKRNWHYHLWSILMFQNWLNSNK
jgi:asparagine synthase (glutamine-hydrolysing)